MTSPVSTTTTVAVLAIALSACMPAQAAQRGARTSLKPVSARVVAQPATHRKAVKAPKTVPAASTAADSDGDRFRYDSCGCSS